MVRQTKNTFPRLFERSTPTVGRVVMNQQPDVEGRKKKKKSRMLKDIRSISDWERVFSSRKRTLMSKALELEHATGAIVTVTVRVSNNVYYYASSQVVKDILTKTPLLKGNSFHVTKKSLAIGLYGLTHACSDTHESDHNQQPSTSVQNRPTTSNNEPVTPIITTPTRQPTQNGRPLKSPPARTAINAHQTSKHPPHPPVQSTPVRPDPPQINLTIASTSKTPPPTVPQVIIPSDSSSESSDSSSSDDSDSSSEESSEESEKSSSKPYVPDVKPSPKPDPCRVQHPIHLRKTTASAPVTKPLQAPTNKPPQISRKPASTFAKTFDKVFSPSKEKPEEQIPNKLTTRSNSTVTDSVNFPNPGQVSEQFFPSSSDTLQQNPANSFLQKPPSKKKLNLNPVTSNPTHSGIPKPAELNIIETSSSEMEEQTESLKKTNQRAFVSREAARASALNSPGQSNVIGNKYGFAEGSLGAYLLSLQMFTEEDMKNNSNPGSYDFLNTIAAKALHDKILMEKTETSENRNDPKTDDGKVEINAENRPGTSMDPTSTSKLKKPAGKFKTEKDTLNNNINEASKQFTYMETMMPNTYQKTKVKQVDNGVKMKKNVNKPTKHQHMIAREENFSSPQHFFFDRNGERDNLQMSHGGENGTAVKNSALIQGHDLRSGEKRNHKTSPIKKTRKRVRQKTQKKNSTNKKDDNVKHEDLKHGNRQPEQKQILNNREKRNSLSERDDQRYSNQGHANDRYHWRAPSDRSRCISEPSQPAKHFGAPEVRRTCANISAPLHSENRSPNKQKRGNNENIPNKSNKKLRVEVVPTKRSNSSKKTTKILSKISKVSSTVQTPTPSNNRMFPNTSLMRGLRHQCRKHFEQYLSNNYLHSDISLKGYVNKLEKRKELLLIPQILTQPKCFKKLANDLKEQLKPYYSNSTRISTLNKFVCDALKGSSCFEIHNGKWLKRTTLLNPTPQ
ncbi:uncharacterized protein LOC100175106 [Ciona intestinalis]